MRTFSIVTILFAISFVVSGCASVIKGSTQSISISTPPATGAICNLSSSQGNWEVMSPGAVAVDKSKEDIQIHCTKAGWQEAASTIPSNFEGWTVGNILLGGIIGLGVDAATGAINDYPHTFQIPMTQISAAGAADRLTAPVSLTPPAPLAAPPPAPTTIPAAPPPPPIAPTAAASPPSEPLPVSPGAGATEGGQTVLFPVTINNPYHPSWTVRTTQ